MASTIRETGRPRIPYRTSLLAVALVHVTLLAGYSYGEPVNPVASGELCPDGSRKLVWHYPADQGQPENATPVDCGPGIPCLAVPQSACLSMVDIKTTAHSLEQPRTINPPDPSSKLPPRVPATPPHPVNQRPAPPTGSASDTPPLPDGNCKAGDGWDFENAGDTLPTHAELDGWKGTTNPSSPFADVHNADLNLIAAPVYGNAVPIERIRPEGWLPSIEATIGGDYWKYSQSINQHGSFWISSLYRRYSWGQHPGVEWDGNSVGTLDSPQCTLQARFLTFKMSGSRAASHRIEVQTSDGDPRDYFGVRFPGGFGDSSLGGTYGHATQMPGAPSAAQLFPPQAGGWTAVRSVTAEDGEEREWMQRYVFDLEPFVGKRIRIRIIDDQRNDCAQFQGSQCVRYRPAHINADEFRFADAAPRGVKWFQYDERKCGNVPGAGDGCSPVGVVPSEPPLWGITDAHAHPMANLAFGGHVIWGDVTDALSDVYDCSHNLAPIPGPGGRSAIDEPAQAHACYVAGDVSIVVTGVALGGCVALATLPWVGAGAAFLCKSIVSAGEAAVLTVPVIQGLDLHGATKFASGAFRLGGILSESYVSYLKVIGENTGNPELDFSPGLLPEVDSWSHAEPVYGWYHKDEKWHSFTGLGKTHNHYQAEMIKRAYEGGMRLGVWDVVNSRAFALVADGNVEAPDWQALKDQTDAAKRIVASSALSGIARIAYTPEEARQIIRQGKMAVVLGSEVDELGRPRPDGLPWPRSPHTDGDSMQKQIDDLWELGIRKVTPVHAVNNPVGGAAIFTKNYVANDHFLNATPVDDSPSFFDNVAVRFILDRSILGTLVKVFLGKYSVTRQVGGDGKTEWNPEGWFEFDSGDPLDPYVGEQELITFRVGEEDPPANTLKDGAGNWLPPDQVLNDQILLPVTLHDLSTLIRPVGRCDLYNTVKPDHAHSFGSTVDSQFVANDGHRNKLGIFRNGADDGEAFLRALMKKGMLLDVDHLSQRMRIEVYALAATYAREAGWQSECQDEAQCGDYPVMGVHTTVRELEKEGSGLPHLIDHFGSNNESTRTPKEVLHVAKNRGLIGVFPRPVLIPPNTSLASCTRNSDCIAWDGAEGGACDNGKCVGKSCNTDADCPTWDSVTAGFCTSEHHCQSSVAERDFNLAREVNNDCDGSSKTFAVKYLWMMQQMGGAWADVHFGLQRAQ